MSVALIQSYLSAKLHMKNKQRTTDAPPLTFISQHAQPAPGLTRWQQFPLVASLLAAQGFTPSPLPPEQPLSPVLPPPSCLRAPAAVLPAELPGRQQPRGSSWDPTPAESEKSLGCFLLFGWFAVLWAFFSLSLFCFTWPCLRQGEAQPADEVSALPS